MKAIIRHELKDMAFTVDELKGDKETHALEWPEPGKIEQELLPVDLLDTQLIPEPFRDFAQDVAERMQCPIDFIVVSLLQVVSIVVGTGCGVRPKRQDDWLIIPNLWGCIVGPPGIMKTPAVSEAIKFLERLEKNAKSEADEVFQKYFIDMESYKAKKEAIKSQLIAAEKNELNAKKLKTTLSPAELKQKLFELEEPKKPIWKRFKTNDATIEKLSELLSENPRGLLIFRDELMGLLNACDKTGHEGDRAFYLEAWNGNSSQTSDRIGRGTIHTNSLCLSIFGTTQPDKLCRYLYSAVHGSNDGLMQRFQLLIYPDIKKNWLLIDRKPNEAAMIRVWKVIEALNKVDFIQLGAIFEEGNRFPYFQFSEDGQNIFYEWLQLLECELREDSEHPILIEHFSKYRKLMPALALLFHLIDCVDGSVNIAISNVNLMRACAFCDYLKSHAKRVYALITDIEQQAAAILAKKIEQRKLMDGFTIRDVYRQKGMLKKAELAKAACDELVATGWLKEVNIPPSKGVKRTTKYLINPKIYRDKNE